MKWDSVTEPLILSSLNCDPLPQAVKYYNEHEQAHWFLYFLKFPFGYEVQAPFPGVFCHDMHQNHNFTEIPFADVFVPTYSVASTTDSDVKGDVCRLS